MMTGLLRPSTDTRDAWLFPAMAATWRRGLGPTPQHYPRPPLVVDAENLQQVLDDDTLHCVCNALCCDRLTVFVRGSHSLAGLELDPPDLENATERANLLDGHDRDYRLHLELRPIAGRCTLEIPVRVMVTASPTAGDSGIVTDIRRQIAVIRRIRGVAFKNFDFNIRVNLYCASADRDKIRFRLQSLLECVTDCPGCAFANCTATISLTVNNLNQHKPLFIDTYVPPSDPGLPPRPGGPGWGGGNAGGGGSGGGGGPGSPGWDNGKYTWPGSGTGPVTPGEPEEPWLEFGARDVVIRAAAFSNCRDAVFFDTRADVNLATDTLIGAESIAYGWLNCGGWLNRLCYASIVNNVRVSGSGQSYRHSDGAHGIMNYALTAQAESRLVANSGGGDIETFAGLAWATAMCYEENQPYHTDAAGNTSHGKIGGAALALSYGMIGNRGGTLAASDVTCRARARHPVSHAALAVPYRSNTAEQSANTGSAEFCDSNLPGWCATNKI